MTFQSNNLLLEIKAGGKSVTGIGGGPGTQNNIEIASAEVILNMNAPRVTMIGCAMGHSKIYSEHTRLELQGSGGHIMGMGSADMGSEIVRKRVGVAIKISSDDPMPIGAKPENCDFGASEPEIQIINYSAEGGEH